MRNCARCCDVWVVWQVAARPHIQRKLDEEREREEGVRWRCRVRQRQRDVEFVWEWEGGRMKGFSGCRPTATHRQRRFDHSSQRSVCARDVLWNASFCFKLGLIDTDASVLRGYYAQPEEREWTCEWTEAEVGAKNPKSCSWRRARGTCASVTSLNMLQLCEKSGASPHVCIFCKENRKNVQWS